MRRWLFTILGVVSLALCGIFGTFSVLSHLHLYEVDRHVSWQMQSFRFDDGASINFDYGGLWSVGCDEGWSSYHTFRLASHLGHANRTEAIGNFANRVSNYAFGHRGNTARW